MITNINKKKGVIAGTTSKNVTVYANIGTTTYSAKSDKNGKFKIKTQKIKKWYTDTALCKKINTSRKVR